MKRILYGIFVMMFAGVMQAQSDNLNPVDTSKLLNITTGEIIVTSTRVENMVKDIALPIEVTSGEQILSLPVNTLPEVLTMKPGISLTRDGIWATDISIRGLSRFNIVTLIDGTRIETATDLSARLSMVDLSDIERVEIIKSGASSLYGTGATGGVVNIITKGGIYNPNKFIIGSFLTGFNSVNKNPYAKLGMNLGGEKWYFKLITSTFKTNK